MKIRLFLIFAFALGCIETSAKVKLPDILGNHMVLQQNTIINLWGSTDPGRKVRITTSWNNAVYTVKANTEGDWHAEVRTTVAGGPYHIIFDDGDRLRLDNILLGDVWVCSGQSNMQMPLKGLSFDGNHIRGLPLPKAAFIHRRAHAQRCPANRL